MVAYRLKINGVQYDNFREITISKERNKPGQFEFVLFNIPTVDYSSNINYNKKVTVEEWDTDTAIYTRIFKGYIRTVEKISFRNSRITGYSPMIRLYDRVWTERQEYVNVPNNIIISAIASGVMGVGTNSITAPTTTRFELDNKLISAVQLTNIHSAELWEDEDGLGNDTLNFALSRYAATSVKTLSIGTNCNISNDQIDNDKIFNCITVLGTGDGINQVTSATYGFCYYLTTLSSNITAIDTSITINNSSGFSATNGIIYINNEKILYANRTGNTLYNLTRGYEGTTAEMHSSGMRVWYAGTTVTEYTKSNPAMNSSVNLYGIREYTYYDKRIIRNLTGDPCEACGKVAEKLFDKFYTPVRTITLTNKKIKLGVLDVGKTITVIDSQTGLNADFKIYSIKIVNKRNEGRELEIVVNNLKYNSETSIDELKKDIDISGIYEQGATNIYAISEAENCDVSHPVSMRFFIPNEAVAINKVLLNFKMKNYRAYSQTTSKESSHTHVIPSLNVNASTTTVNSDLSKVTGSGGENAAVGINYGWTTIATVSPGNNDGEKIWFHIAITDPDVRPGDLNSIFVKIVSSSGVTYPNNTDKQTCRLVRGYGYTSGPLLALHGSCCIVIPENPYMRTYTIQAKITGSASGEYPFYCDIQYSYMLFDRHHHSITGVTTQSDTSNHGSAHNHGLSFGIYEETLTGGQVTVAVGEDGGSMTDIGTFGADQTELDITSNVQDIGVGNWCDIRFTPNKNMRIESNAYIQIYIESKI